MPTLKIDGQEVTVPAGTTIIEAAKKAGNFIPHYCYHPGLSIAGNCRMCLVEIEKNPKLQIACNTQVADGMMVKTDNERVKSARQDILEFLLVNHPLDCPVCDQSGECELQNYYMNYGLYESSLMENKVKKPKAVPIGPAVMLDAERCVLCSRCVRFCNEVTKTDELGIVNRGDHAEIQVAPGKELKNDYSGNVVDICPVGALTDRDFRFKCRVWFLETSPSVCPGCSRGCNIEIHWNSKRPYQTPSERVMRLKPRFNNEVNKWWICDEGRYGYNFIDQNRIQNPQVRSNGQMKDISWNEALQQWSHLLSRPQETAVLVSTDLTNEDLWVAKEFFGKKVGVKKLGYWHSKKLGEEDNLLKKADKTPNTKGAEILGFEDISQSAFDSVMKGEIRQLVLFGQDMVQLLGKETADQLRLKLVQIVTIASNENGSSFLADLILPAAVYAEKDGTFTNFEGRVQRIRKALSPVGQAKAEWEIIRDLGREAGWDFQPDSPRSVFEAMAQKVTAFKGMSHESLGNSGLILGQKIVNESQAYVG